MLYNLLLKNEDFHRKLEIYASFLLKSSADMEITWGHCPHVPKENGGLPQNICDKNAAVSIVIVGDSKCGKTQLINRFSNGFFTKVSNGKPIFCFYHLRCHFLQNLILFNLF